MSVDFVHLHTHTDFSILDGAAKIKKLVKKAKDLGQKALAITDHGNMFGVVDFENECITQGIKPIIGSEFYIAPESRFDKKEVDGRRYYHLILLAKNETGYRNLMRLSSLSYTEGMYYKPRIDDEILEKYSEGLICLTACLAGRLPVLLLENKFDEAEKHLKKYLRIFGADNLFIELQYHGLDNQKKVNPLLVSIARKLGIPLVATNDVHYVEQQDYIAHDVLMCIGMKKTRNDPNRLRFEGCEFYLKSAEQMASLFPEYPEAILNTVRIAQMCDLKIPKPGALLPVYEIPLDFSAKEDYIRHLVFEGLKTRYETITDEIKKRAEYELGIIIKLDFVGYYLIVWDFIYWAKERNIPVGPGRGSGAGSIIAYALGITDIDPLKYNLLFERFLNTERVSMPDFDVDFCFERRQEVIDYVRQKYGDASVGQIITFGTLKAKAVIKDVGRVLEIPLSEVNAITKFIPDKPPHPDVKKVTLETSIKYVPEMQEFANNPGYKELFEIAMELEDVNRNTSLHAAGIVIGKTELPDYVPVYKDSSTGKVATQFTMDKLEDCGLVKMDFLGLKTLTLIKHTEDLIRARGGEYSDFSVENANEHDELTFKMLCDGHAEAVFQFESDGMKNILKRAKPTTISDLIALNALYRPGPMQFIDQFIKSKHDHSQIKYPHPCLEPILKETYGVIVYQEQVMQVAQKIAGYSLGAADMLRRAMSKKKADEMAKHYEKFIKGAVERNFDAKIAEEIFNILIPFSKYGFNKSHAAAYSVLAYRTAYLKAHFPAEFWAANLTNEINSTDKLNNYILTVKKNGLKLIPPDINKSEPVFSVSGGDIVFGLIGIKGVGEAAAEQISRERNENGEYTSFMNLIERVNLQTVTKKTLENLINAGCFDNIDMNRPTLLTNLEGAYSYADKKNKEQNMGQASLFESAGIDEYAKYEFKQMPDWPQSEKLRKEKELMGFYISGHPLEKYKTIIEKSANLNLGHIEKAQKDKIYTITGMLTEVSPYTTKKGNPMAFGQFEDLNGTIKLLFFPNVWTQNKIFALPETVCAVTGKIDTKHGEPSFLVEKIIPLTELKEKSISEVHIEIDSKMASEQNLKDLQNILYDSSGTCNVFVHLNHTIKGFIIQIPQNIKVPSDDKFLNKLSMQNGVTNVWKE
ncbi:MAG: DNA polymerase III subunit alpha [Treponema sp.]|nr:MAG: DNA polymerase III subunit alpha [Treponema sp.]